MIRIGPELIYWVSFQNKLVNKFNEIRKNRVFTWKNVLYSL